MNTLAEMKAGVAKIEAKVIAEKGDGYLKALYDREGVSQFNCNSLDYFKAQLAALTVEAARMEGETAAASATSIAPQRPATSPRSEQSHDAMSADKAIAHYEALVNDAQPNAAAKFWEENQRLMVVATGWADRATSAADAEAKYMRLVQLGRSYEAGVFWQTNRDLLRR
jgi:hypothetical protein